MEEEAYLTSRVFQTAKVFCMHRRITSLNNRRHIEEEAYLAQVSTVQGSSSTSACSQGSSMLEPRQRPLLPLCSLGMHKPLDHRHGLPTWSKA